MYCLFFDQSFREGVIALLRDGLVVEEVYAERSRHPCAVFEELLSRQALRLNDVGFLACGVGPGSYTGIRSAAATIQSVSYATGLPIVAVPSLLVFSPVEKGRYLLAADAGISGAFVQEVDLSESGCFPAMPEAWTIGRLCEKVSSGAKMVVASGGWLKKKADEGRWLHESAYKEVSSHAVVVAQFSYQEYGSGRCYTSSHLPLFYLRKTQAEIDQQSSRS